MSVAFRSGLRKRPRHAGLIPMLLAAGAILLFFFLALDSLVDDSPTMDEQNHIARGLAFLRTGDPRLSLEHPPLINSISALPLLTMPQLRLPFDHPSWERREGWYEFADLFLWQYNHDTNRIVFLARYPIVILTLMLALAAFRFAGRLWGRAAALPALVLFLFEPNIMAHGRYSTTDIGVTLFTFLTTMVLWRLWHRPASPSWRTWALVSVLMGLSFAGKLSALGFVFVWSILALLPIYDDSEGRYFRSSLRRLAMLVAAGMASLLIVWASFAFQWGQFGFVSDPLVPFNGWRGPMPTFWAGLEQIAMLGGSGRSLAFLFGRFSETGWTLYFPTAFVVKTPIPLLIMILVAGFVLIIQRTTRKRAIFLTLAAIAFYALAMQGALNIGYRHVLPALPYILLLVSGLAAPELRTMSRISLSPRKLLAVGSGCLIIIALWVHPHYLGYFNLAVGGPANGYRVLTDSNVDWGQDLIRLKQWMTANDVERVELGWFGTADPDYYGISYNPMPGLGRDKFFRLWWELPFDPARPHPGIYAISASSLWEPPLRVEEKQVYAWFRDREPDDRVGNSILIYRVQ